MEEERRKSCHLSGMESDTGDKQLHSGEEDLRGARKPKVLGKPDVGNLALGNACLQEGKK